MRPLGRKKEVETKDGKRSVTIEEGLVQAVRKEKGRQAELRLKLVGRLINQARRHTD